ncbi:hypothetical protein J7T55_006340 [Diaporthe amygdali]|uniref:uncharacterized protein n=1 Tax=Phomopsis amygdali TaxID=1214568 RepID=UPI0022FE367A|nr:uncharacterized protein J7T55_006340 [Diaporthe amygdali]KAJ0124997.1 hypothetical protein J7T55_006340 [Diaporthe amygdali]
MPNLPNLPALGDKSPLSAGRPLGGIDPYCTTPQHITSRGGLTWAAVVERRNLLFPQPPTRDMTRPAGLRILALRLKSAR